MTAGASICLGPWGGPGCLVIPPGVTRTRAGPGEEHAGHGRARDARGQALGTRSCGGDGPQMFPFFVSDLGIWRHGFDVNIRFTCSFIYSKEVDCGPTGRCTLAGDRSQTWQLGRRERGLPRARKGRLAVGPEGGRGGAGAEGSGRPEKAPGGPGSRTAYGEGQTRRGGSCVYPKGFLQERVTVSPPALPAFGAGASPRRGRCLAGCGAASEPAPRRRLPAGAVLRVPGRGRGVDTAGGAELLAGSGAGPESSPGRGRSKVTPPRTSALSSPCSGAFSA